MTSPVPQLHNPLPESPSELLGGLPDDPLGSIGVGRRASGRRRSLGLLGDPSAKAPRAPGSPASRAQGRANAQIVRSSAPAPSASSPKLATPARPDRARTAAGAPVEAPREIPKMGGREAERDAARHGMTKASRALHRGMSHRTQRKYESVTRQFQDETRHELDDSMLERLAAISHRLSEQGKARREAGKPPKMDAETRRNRKAAQQAFKAGGNPGQPGMRRGEAQAGPLTRTDVGETS